MKRIIPVLIALCLIIILSLGYFGMDIIDRFIPSKEMANNQEYFQVDENQVAIILNDQLQMAKGIVEDEQIYLPLEWINMELNEKFFWDQSEEKLIYTLPEEIVYADKNTKGSNGKPLLWVDEDGIYLSAGLVKAYTDISFSTYDSENIKRIYIDNRWEKETFAALKKDGNLRQKGGIKSPIIEKIEKGSKVRIIEQLENWSKVFTDTGYIGYIENKQLCDETTEQKKSSFKAPEYTSISVPEKISLVWHQVTSMAANQSMQQMIAKTKGVNVISPTWYSFTDNDGNFKSYASKDYVNQAHNMGMQVWALIDNFDKNVNTAELLKSLSGRKKIIEKLMEETKKYNLDGLNLDFEGVRSDAGEYYVQFIRELSVSCRKNKIILSIDNYVPAVYNNFYNWKEQGNVADYVIIMGYDEHFAGGDAGSVASIGYVTQGIEDMLDYVPKEKLINGVPFYTRVWTVSGEETKSEAMGIKRAKQWIEENQVSLEWDGELGQYYGEKTEGNQKKMIWMEEEKSMDLKMNVIKKNDLAGVAGWKLGFEPEDLWDIVRYK